MKQRVFKTKEGITVISDYCKDVKGITFEMYFQAGALNDPIGKSGLAHFCEHVLMSFSTKQHTRKERAENLHKFQQFNAFTSDYEVCFYIMTTKNKIAQAVDVLSEPFSDLLYKQDEFDSEYNIICDEISTVQQRNDMLRKFVYNRKFAKNKEIKNLEYSKAGSLDSIKKIKLKDVKQFIDEYFNLENLIINVAGNLKINEIQKLISKYIVPRIKNKGKKGFALKDHLGYKEPSFCFAKACEPQQSLIYIDYCINKIDERGYYNRDWYIENRVISHVLHHYATNYFRLKKELCYFCNSTVYQNSDGIHLKVQIDCQDGNVARVLEEYPTFIQGVIENFTEESFNIAKDVLIDEINFDYIDISNKAYSNYKQYDIFGYLLGEKEAKHDEDLIKSYRYEKAIERVSEIKNQKPTLIIISNDEKYKDFDYKEFCKKSIIKNNK